MDIPDAWKQRGWVQPIIASPVTADGIESAEIIDSMSPVFGFDDLWGWQLHGIAVIASRRSDGLPLYETVVIIVCRQNGKTSFVALVIWWLLALGYRILFTLHERAKGLDKFEEIAAALVAVDPGRYRVIRKVGAEKAIDLVTGGRMALATPDDAGGRSMTADVIIADEAAHLKLAFLRSAGATTATIPHAQTIMISSGGMLKSEDLSRARHDAIDQLTAEADDRTTGILEFGIKIAPGVHDVDVSDEALWRKGIPTLGEPGGVTYAHLRSRVTKIPRDDFAREYLSVWTEDALDHPIDETRWNSVLVNDIAAIGKLRGRVMAVDTDPDQTRSAVSIAGVRADGSIGAFVAATDDGDAWLPATVDELWAKHRPLALIVDGLTPARQVAETMKAKGRRVVITTGSAMAASCAALVTLIARDGLIAIARDDELTMAAVSARRRYIGDTGWAFRRRPTTEMTSDNQKPSVPIQPVVSVALAVHHANTIGRAAGTALIATVNSEDHDAPETARVANQAI